MVVFSLRFYFPFFPSPILPLMREGVEMAAGGRLFLWQAIDPLAWFSGSGSLGQRNGRNRLDGLL